MKKIFFQLYTGFCGCDGTHLEEFDDDVTDDYLNHYAWELAIENADMYGIYDANELEEEDVNDNNASWDIAGHWELYNPAKHDMLLVGYDDLTEGD